MKAKLVIENITTNVNFEITSDNGLISFTRGQQSITDNTSVYYGVTAGYGNAKFYDNENIIERYANLGYLKDNKKVRLYLGDEIVGTYETADFSKDGLIVTIEFQDLLIRSQSIDVPFYSKPLIGNDVLTEFYYNVENNGYTFANGIKDEITNILSLYKIPDTIKKSTLWDRINKFCQLGQFCVFLNENGEIDLDVNPNRKTLKIANSDYYTMPKLSPFNNNYTSNVSMNGYVQRKSTESKTLNGISFEGINTSSGLPFNLYSTSAINYYGKNILYIDDIENENFVKAYQPALKQKFIQEEDDYGYNHQTRINLMYFRVKVPIGQDDNTFIKKLWDNVLTVDLKYTARKFIYTTNGSINSNQIFSDSLKLIEQINPSILQNETNLDNNFNDYVQIEFTLANHNIDINRLCFWFNGGGKDLELLILVPASFYYTYDSIQGYTYMVEAIYEKYEITINGVYTFTYEPSEVKRFDDKETDLKLSSNELINIRSATNIVKEVYDDWANGKKTLNFTCYKGNYYDTNGNLVYNESSGDTIKVGDTIIPYRKIGGVEKPIGNVDDNTPIEYVVTSSEIEYNGNTKLHLSVVEK